MGVTYDTGALIAADRGERPADLRDPPVRGGRSRGNRHYPAAQASGGDPGGGQRLEAGDPRAPAEPLRPVMPKPAQPGCEKAECLLELGPGQVLAEAVV